MRRDAAGSLPTYRVVVVADGWGVEWSYALAPGAQVRDADPQGGG